MDESETDGRQLFLSRRCLLATIAGAGSLAGCTNATDDSGSRLTPTASPSPTPAEPPSVSVDIVSFDQLGPNWRHTFVPRTGGGAADERAFRLPTSDVQIDDELADTRDGPSDLSADVYLGYDTDNFYLRAEVTDDVHNSLGGKHMWRADCVQFAFADGSTYGPDYTIRHPAELFRWRDGTATAEASTVDLRTNRDGNTTTYEVTLPWNAIFATRPSPGDQIPFDLVVHERDEKKHRLGGMEWSPWAIYTPKQPELLGLVTLQADGKQLPWEAALEGPERLEHGERGTWTVTIANYADTTQRISMVLQDSDLARTIDVPARNAARVTIERTYVAPGTGSLVVGLDNGRTTRTLYSWV